MRPPIARTVFALALSTAACGNTYHPEYHPVNVTHYQQHIAGPVTLAGAEAVSPVILAPAPPPPPVVGMPGPGAGVIVVPEAPWPLE